MAREGTEPWRAPESRAARVPIEAHPEGRACAAMEVSMRRLLVIALPFLAFACATAPKAEFQEVRRFHPGSEQLQLVYSRWVQPDGSFVKDGDTQAWYADGTARLKAHYAMDKADGAWTEWFANGQMRLDGKFQLGQKIGEWCEWNEQGKLVMRSHWSEGRLDGDYRCFDDDGMPLMAGNFARGLRQGEWTC